MLEKLHFYSIATPIGNLEDITFRAVRLLKEVNFIACEDTRVTKNLLNHYGIRTSLLTVNAHNERSAAATVLSRLQDGQQGALVSDAGTPGISDPGAILLDILCKEGVKIIPIPGASAAITTLSAHPFSHFLFYGFLPSKAGDRLKTLRELSHFPYALVFYEAPHRMIDLFLDLIEVFHGARQAVLAKELTKVYETILKDSLEGLLSWLKADENHQKGEFVIIVYPQQEVKDENEGEKALAILLQHLPLKKAVAVAAALSGISKNHLYQRALQWQKNCE